LGVAWGRCAAKCSALLAAGPRRQRWCGTQAKITKRWRRRRGGAVGLKCCAFQSVSSAVVDVFLLLFLLVRREDTLANLRVRVKCCSPERATAKGARLKWPRRRQSPPRISARAQAPKRHLLIAPWQCCIIRSQTSAAFQRQSLSDFPRQRLGRAAAGGWNFDGVRAKGHLPPGVLGGLLRRAAHGSNSELWAGSSLLARGQRALGSHALNLRLKWCAWLPKNTATDRSVLLEARWIKASSAILADLETASVQAAATAAADPITVKGGGLGGCTGA